MSVINAEALVLDVLDLQEADRIVVFLARGMGKKRGVAKGAKRRFSRFSGRLQPLARVQMVFFEKASSELVRIQEAEILRSAQALQHDLPGVFLGSYLAEHTLVFAQEDESNDPMFRLLDTTVGAVLAGVNRNLAARYFEAWVLRLAGLFPAPELCPVCDGGLEHRAVLPPDGDGLVCGACGGNASGAESGLQISGRTLAFLRDIGRQRLDAWEGELPDAGLLHQVEVLCREVRRRFLQGELKSYRVAQETLGVAPGQG
jgi:DNA repair protein RecO (recombination protein O)